MFQLQTTWLSSRLNASACCMLPAHPLLECQSQCAVFTLHSVYVSELCFYSCFSSAPTPHHNTPVPKGLHLWSTGEHRHPLWSQGEAESQVRQSLLPLPLPLTLVFQNMCNRQRSTQVSILGEHNFKHMSLVSFLIDSRIERQKLMKPWCAKDATWELQKSRLNWFPFSFVAPQCEIIDLLLRVT